MGAKVWESYTKALEDKCSSGCSIQLDALRELMREAQSEFLRDTTTSLVVMKMHPKPPGRVARLIRHIQRLTELLLSSNEYTLRDTEACWLISMSKELRLMWPETVVQHHQLSPAVRVILGTLRLELRAELRRTRKIQLRQALEKWRAKLCEDAQHHWKRIFQRMKALATVPIVATRWDNRDNIGGQNKGSHPGMVAIVDAVHIKRTPTGVCQKLPGPVSGVG